MGRGVARDLTRADDLTGRVDVDGGAVRTAECAEILNRTRRAPQYGVRAPSDDGAVADDLTGVVDRHGAGVEVFEGSRQDRKRYHRDADRHESARADDGAGLRDPDDHSSVVDVNAALGVAAAGELHQSRAGRPAIWLEVLVHGDEPELGTGDLARGVEATRVPDDLDLTGCARREDRCAHGTRERPLGVGRRELAAAWRGRRIDAAGDEAGEGEGTTHEGSRRRDLTRGGGGLHATLATSEAHVGTR